MSFYRHLSDRTFIIAFTVGLVSSLLSLLGSAWIICNILRRRKHATSLFHRIMLGLSTADCFSTTAVVLQAFLVPRETDLLFARGNDTTCSVVGVLMMTMVASYVYSCELSMYFLLIVRKDGTKLQLSRFPRWEPWLHITPWLLTVALAILGIVMHAFTPSPVLGACWLGCTYTDTRDDCLPNTAVYAYRPFTLVAFGSFLTGIVCTGMVFLLVRWKIQRNNQHVFCPPSTTVATSSAMATEQSSSFHRDRRSSHMAFRQSNGSNGSDNHQPYNNNSKNLATVAQQALCYTAAFANSFLVNVLGVVVAFWEVKEDGRLDRPYLVITVFLVYTLYPLQGWIHFLIYSRPAVARWREAYPYHSYVWSLWNVLLGRSVIDSTAFAGTTTAPLPDHKVMAQPYPPTYPRRRAILANVEESETSPENEDDTNRMMDLALESVELSVLTEPEPREDQDLPVTESSSCDSPNNSIDDVSTHNRIEATIGP